MNKPNLVDLLFQQIETISTKIETKYKIFKSNRAEKQLTRLIQNYQDDENRDELNPTKIMNYYLSFAEEYEKLHENIDLKTRDYYNCFILDLEKKLYVKRK